MKEKGDGRGSRGGAAEATAPAANLTSGGSCLVGYGGGVSGNEKTEQQKGEKTKKTGVVIKKYASSLVHSAALPCHPKKTQGRLPAAKAMHQAEKGKKTAVATIAAAVAPCCCFYGIFSCYH